MSGMVVCVARISSSLSRTFRAFGRPLGVVLSISLISVKIYGMARNASSSCSHDAFSSMTIQLSILSRFAWKLESVRLLLPPVLLRCFVVRCLMKSWGFFFSMKLMISKNTQANENMSAFSVSCTLDRGFGAGFVFRNPKLNPLKSFVGALDNFLPKEPLLADDPDELLLATEVCRAFATTGAAGAPG